ncbi:MAG: tetratricopeptide repeat protein [Treponema sp.]|jgi:tetratricopeptide (TPR) repeat protein|nr:tetratricopeptide repeat protein [Treponema sp.]
MQNKTENVKLAEKLTDFIQRNRKGIFIITGTIIFLFAGFVVYLSVSDYLNKKYIVAVEELSGRYDEIADKIGDDPFALDIEELISDSKNFAGNKRGLPAGKAWSIAANIYSQRKEWPQSEDAWQKAAAAGNKTYLGPIALFNAAAAAQEQGKYEQAIEYLEKCVGHKFEFPSAPRAQFSIGSLYERLDNYPAALEAYREVLIKWPDLPVWQQLARSRIAAIEIR